MDKLFALGKEHLAQAHEQIRATAKIKEGWKYRVTEKEIEIYSRKEEGGNVFSTKGFGIIDGTIEDVISLFREVNLRSEWDPMYKEGDVIEDFKDANRTKVVHLVFHPQWPTASRDFCNIQSEVHYDDGCVSLAAVQLEHPKVPPTKDVVRGICHLGAYYLEPLDGGKKTYVTMILTIDPKGQIPTFVVNLVSVKQPMAIDGLRKAILKRRKQGAAAGLLAKAGVARNTPAKDVTPQCPWWLYGACVLLNRPLPAVSRVLVEVVEARDLPVADIGGSSDPYAYVSCRKVGQKMEHSQAFKTPTVFKNLNPVWNETFLFETCTHLEDSVLHVEVWDKDLTSDDHLGSISLPFTQLLSSSRSPPHTSEIQVISPSCIRSDCWLSLHREMSNVAAEVPDTEPSMSSRKTSVASSALNDSFDQREDDVESDGDDGMSSDGAVSELSFGLSRTRSHSSALKTFDSCGQIHVRVTVGTSTTGDYFAHFTSPAHWTETHNADSSKNCELLVADVYQLVSYYTPLCRFLNRIRGVWSWEHPALSFLSLLVCLLFAYHIEDLFVLVPLLLAVCCVFSGLLYRAHQFSSTTPLDALSDQQKHHLRVAARRLLQRHRSLMFAIQVTLNTICATLQRLHQLMFWENRKASFLFVCVLLCMSTVARVAGAQYLVAIVGSFILVQGTAPLVCIRWMLNCSLDFFSRPRLLSRCCDYGWS
eukprot:GILK01010180.1.p1 GENE.GILK01010180.1~~GILK01010180.1.p1  ORF type:complete len:716 (+),score=82.87 GILK01010180.1:36-2150(+)